MKITTLLRAFPLFLGLACTSVYADTFTLNPNAADGMVQHDSNGNNTVINTGDYAARIGEYFAPGGVCYVIPFQVPTLTAGQVFSSASFQFQLYDKGANEANADLYAVRFNTSPNVAPSDYYQGVNADPSATRLQAGILTNSTPVRVDANNGFVTTSAAANSSLVAFLNSADLNNSLAGQYLFLRISYATDIIPNGNNYYTLLTEDAGGPNEKPLLTLTSNVGAAVPEPATYCLVTIGALGGLALRRRMGA